MNRRRRKKEMGKLKEVKVLKKLESGQHRLTRDLWREVFWEDSEAFLDYYYTHKTNENEIYAALTVPQRAVSMVQLNPYQVHLNNTIQDVHYIVGVATLPQYRHRGLMRILLNLAFRESYGRSEPFLFLMPASEAIYLPFDFRTVYYQNQKQVSLADARNLVRAAEYRNIKAYAASLKDAPLLAEFSERMLSASYGVYVKRTAGYFEKMMLEQESEDGCVLVFESQGEIVGYCFLAGESEVEVWELVTEEGWEEDAEETLKEYVSQTRGKSEAFKLSAFPAMLEDVTTQQVPLIMTRIIHLEAFAACLRAKREISFWLQTEDPIIPENHGLFYFKVGPNSATARKMNQPEEGAMVVEITVAEISQVFFGGKVKQGIPCKHLYPLKEVFINEVV